MYVYFKHCNAYFEIKILTTNFRLLLLSEETLRNGTSY